ncbi:single-stranded DNA-binding protein [bacterium]|nr:single-stranded DNA-binding protein [bacterium]
MVSFNKVILIGRLTKDPELRYTNAGIPVTNLSIAINERVKKGDEWSEDTLFVDKITVWQRQAETAAEYLKKGRLVLIEGRLKKNQWETESGEKRSNLEIVASRVQFLSAKPDDSTSEPPDMEPMKDDAVPF